MFTFIEKLTSITIEFLNYFNFGRSSSHSQIPFPIQATEKFLVEVSCLNKKIKKGLW